VNGFPFEVPPPYDTVPLLKGRATVEMEVKIKNNALVESGVMTMVLDGYNAPVTCGNFAVRAYTRPLFGLTQALSVA